jgi:hypothetical protein
MIVVLLVKFGPKISIITIKTNKHMSENQIIRVQAYLAPKLGFPCPSVRIVWASDARPLGLYPSQSQRTSLLKPIQPVMRTDQLFFGMSGMN